MSKINLEYRTAKHFEKLLLGFIETLSDRMAQ